MTSQARTAVRGSHNIAGEFGHVPLSLDGPRCSRGSTGCWEAYISNRGTLARYFGRPVDEAGPARLEQRAFTIEDLISRARADDAKAVTAIQATARYLGLGLASVVNATDPARVYIGGEITAAWDLIESTARAALAERAPDAGGRRDGHSGGAGERIPAAPGRRRARRGAGVCRARGCVISRRSAMSDAPVTLEPISPGTCVVRNTAARKGRAWALRPGPTASRHLHYGRHIVTISYSTDTRTWTRFGTAMEVSGYHHNVAGEFLSLRPAIYAAGNGEVRFRQFVYRALD